MALAESPYSGSRDINLMPCTSGKGRLCHIFREISVWNEYFWQVGLELREQSPGRLSLVENHEANARTYPSDRNMVDAVATLLHYLLTLHHCVNSVTTIDSSTFWDHKLLICDALCKSLSLTKLKLYALHSSRDIAAALLHLNHLRELELKSMPFRRTFIDGLSEFLASTSTLTTLTMTQQIFHCEEDALTFVQGLRRNKTITTLSFELMLLGAEPVHNLPVMPVSPRCNALFADYLRGNKTLRTLTVIGGYFESFAAVAHPIIGALIENNTLTKLSIFRCLLKGEDMELITRLLGQNSTLTSFNMINCDGPGGSSWFHAYLAALTRNKTLEELTLDLSRFNTTESQSLIGALASNPSLKKVTVEHFTHVDVAEICKAVRDTGVQESFILGQHCVRDSSVDALGECRELSSVKANSQLFGRFESLLTTLSLLQSSSHVRSLCLELLPDHFRGSVSTLLAQCITGMTGLRNLKLSIGSEGIGDAFAMARRELAQALSVNKSIRRLGVYGPWFGETETEMLADALLSSRTLYQLSFFPYSQSCVISLMRKLSPNVSSNYTILDMHLERPWILGSDWFSVADVTRRNCSLVTRAAHFVMGRERLKYYAAAAELVQFNPRLVEKVQELASVDEDEAVSRIKKSLKTFSELDGFMRLAGVVKHGVTCHNRDDGQMQLVDIGRDCWLCIRQYIKVSDITDEQ
ncbi:hypothetical protein MTO96_046273 [Rhipicephalus appendiculatus]